MTVASCSASKVIRARTIACSRRVIAIEASVTFAVRTLNACEPFTNSLGDIDEPS